MKNEIETAARAAVERVASQGYDPHDANTSVALSIYQAARKAGASIREADEIANRMANEVEVEA